MGVLLSAIQYDRILLRRVCDQVRVQHVHGSDILAETLSIIMEVHYEPALFVDFHDHCPVERSIQGLQVWIIDLRGHQQRGQEAEEGCDAAVHG